MRNEQTQTELNWTALGGRILDGGYELEELLEASDATARFKVRVLGDRTLESVASFCRMSPAAASRQVEIWQALKSYPHPNLDSPLAAGHAKLDGTELAYVILRKADETLSGALVERALTTAEAAEVLRNVAAALGYLNEKALVHGCVAPDQILSVGQAIQLSVEPIGTTANEPRAGRTPKYLAPESTNGNGTPESDVWCLGATLVEALTQKNCRGMCLQMARELPVPFAWVAERCLEEDPRKRAKAADISNLLAEGEKPAVRAAAAGATIQGASVAPAAVPSAAAELPIAQAREKSLAAESLGSAASYVEEPVAKAPALQDPVLLKPVEARAAAMRSASLVRPATPRTSTAPAIPPPFEKIPPRLDQRRRLAQEQSSRLWLYAICAAVVVLLMLWWVWPRRAKPSAVAASPIAAAQTQTLTPEGTASQNGVTQTGAPPAQAPAPATSRITRTETSRNTIPTRAASPKILAQAPAVNGSTWRVVVFTYNRSEDAQRKARTINGRYPKLGAAVFAPSERSGPYLVTLGGTMSRETALRLRQKAISNGLPRDSYIQNYRK